MRHKRIITAVLIGLLAAIPLALLYGGTAQAVDSTIVSRELLSKTPAGGIPETGAWYHTMSRDGRFIAYTSNSDDILPGQVAPDSIHLYLYDRQTGATVIADRDETGQIIQASGPDFGGTNFKPSLSDDGRYLLFPSRAISGVNVQRLFLYDRQTGTSQEVSPQDPSLRFGTPSHAMSGDANVIIYNTTGNQGETRWYVYNRSADTRTQLPAGTTVAAISGNGRYVTYTVEHYDPETDTSTNTHHYRDLTTGTTIDINNGIPSRRGPIALNYDGSRIMYYGNPEADESGNIKGDIIIQAMPSGQIIHEIDANTFITNVTSVMNFSDNSDIVTYPYIGEGGVMETRVVNFANNGQQLTMNTTSPFFRFRDAAMSGDARFVTYSQRAFDDGPNLVYLAELQHDLIPATPTGLTAPSPTNQPVLSWNASANATSYNVYRDGALIASPTTATYTDTTATEGTRSYTVAAVNSSSASAQSPAVSVLVDKTPPTMTSASITPAFFLFGGTGTYNATATDALTAITAAEVYVDADPGVGNSQAATVNNGAISGTISTDSLSSGLHRLYIRAKDAAGNWSASRQVFFFKLF